MTVYKLFTVVFTFFGTIIWISNISFWVVNNISRIYIIILAITQFNTVYLNSFENSGTLKYRILRYSYIQI